MMKLKYLFDNRDLAHMVLKNWDHDAGRLDILDHYRISANAVYPFRSDQGICYLRFSPAEEHSPDQVLAELDFIEHLCAEGYPANPIIPSLNGRKLEEVNTPWGNYIASVFKGVPGKRLDRIELTDRIIFGYGQALGNLHKASRTCTPGKHRRLSWKDHLNQVREMLHEYDNTGNAPEEATLLYNFLSRLPAAETDFGLIHYDFETDNVFYDEEKDRFHVIDFDDAMYHWFAMDIDQALYSLSECIPAEQQEKSRDLFIKGYRTIFSVEDTMLELLPAFRRYANLLGYTRILVASREEWDNEPDWMTKLREKLKFSVENRSKNFGKPIQIHG